jgi:hypothetical protein
LVDGGVTTGKQIDCREWVSTFKYSLKKFPLFGSFGAETFNEFYSPEAVVNRVGYQVYEWYRFYAVPVLKSGKSLNAFFAFDVRFVSQADYLANLDEFQFLSTNETDRRNFAEDDFVNYDLGDDDQNLFQYYLELNGVDWNYQIDGIPVRDLFEEVRIYRADLVPEVLNTGIWAGAANRLSSAPGAEQIYDFPFSLRAFVGDIGGSTTLINYNTDPSLPQRKIASFYSPDNLIAAAPVSFIDGDELLTFGQFKIVSLSNVRNVGNRDSFFNIFNGILGSTQANRYDIDNVLFAATNELTDTPFGDYNKQTVEEFFLGSEYQYGREQSSPLIITAQDVQNNSINLDRGLYYAIYFRGRSNKYGTTIQNNVTIYCNAKVKVDESSCTIFGGDTFTQQMWLKKKYFRDVTNTGGADGFNIISQNKNNTNLRLWDSSTASLANFVFPVTSTNDIAWLENDPDKNDQLISNPAYKVLNQVQAQAVYDPENQDTGEYLSRKYWSQFKPNNSAVDFFRIILPLDFQDNPEIQGAIKRLVNLNNRLFTIQERGFTLEYFNNQGQLVSQDAGQILIGDGSVLSRIGNNLSLFGLKQSGAFVRGKSQSGKDTAMWINTTFTNVLRFGDDGIKNVSLRDLNRTFFNRYLKWANNADTPADGYGISGTWDNDNSNYIFTVKAWKPYKQWDANVTYLGDDAVIFGEIEQGIPQIWTANQASRGVEPADGVFQWQRVDILDPLFYNCYSFAYSEIKNGFTFYPYFLPNFYAQWKGKYLTANPNLESIDKSKIYLHGEGLPNQFYGVNYTGGVIELTMNFQPNMNKKVLALMINSNIKPERVDIESLFRNEPDGERIKKSFLVTSDFETREGYQYSTIKLELDENGNNDRNTSMMEGVWTKFRIQFPAGVSAKLNDCIVLISDSLRTFNPIN